MKQATILICAFLVIFQVCLTVCYKIDTSATSADSGTVTVKVSDLGSSAWPLNDLSGRWAGYSINGDSSITDDKTVVTPISKNSQAENLLPSRNNPSKKLLLYGRRSSDLENSSGVPQLNNVRDGMVQTTPQLT